MALMRIFLVIGIVVSAALGVAWVLGLVPDAEAQRLLGKTASILGILVGAVFGIYLVTGGSKGSKK